MVAASQNEIAEPLLHLCFLRDQSLGEPLALIEYLKYFVEAQSESAQCG